MARVKGEPERTAASSAVSVSTTAAGGGVLFKGALQLLSKHSR